jgi:hypothetical protein
MARLDVMERQGEFEQSEPASSGILIGIPTFNNESTIATVVATARTASLRFPETRTIVAQFDGGSTDATIERGRHCAGDDRLFVQGAYPVYPVHRLGVTYHSIPGMDSAYRAIFAKAEELNVKACCVLAPDDSSLGPDTVAALIRPILESGVDMTTPVYPPGQVSGVAGERTPLSFGAGALRQRGASTDRGKLRLLPRAGATVP